MPKFELTGHDPERPLEIIRARTPQLAIQQWAGVHEGVLIEIETERDFDRYKGWSIIRIEGREVGRIRPHHRMQFRRA